MADSRISGLYKLSVGQRVDELRRLGWVSNAAATSLRHGRQTLTPGGANSMVENVIGVFGLPLAVVPNFFVNEKDALVPMVVEEPSIVAALSNAAAMARNNGGFTCSNDESLLIGQVHVTNCQDIDAALQRLQKARLPLLVMANAVHPRLTQRGGGVRDIEFRTLSPDDGDAVLVVHLLVDTCDAMGANLVNTICEAVAPEIARICDAEIALRILSNLTDRSVVTATVRYSVADLGVGDLSGPEVRDRIVLANDIAVADPYRAATHNKGIMNGVDAVAIATGNDWRAIEAAAHAYAARGGRYCSLTQWSAADNGDLVGQLQLPIKVATVGGTLKANPAAELGLAITAVESATELAHLMTAVGLAQNFAALRALVSTGIQKGHMRLHARSVAAAAGADSNSIDAVVNALVASGEVKDWKASEILQSMREHASGDGSVAAGKIILLGEHAVVYGKRALAVPIPNAVRASATVASGSTRLRIAEWSFDAHIDRSSAEGIEGVANLILRSLGVAEQHFDIQLQTLLPGGMGLGSSAAVAVAATRAIALCCGQPIDDERVNSIAFECEKLAHGTPSGVDNALSCFAVPMLFRKDGQLKFDTIGSDVSLPLLVAFSDQAGRTSEMVADVHQRRSKNQHVFDRIFEQIDALAIEGAEALRNSDWTGLGALMNINHGLLNAIGVSTPELESMVSLARSAGAVGAKLTGAGGGGAMVALCPTDIDDVRATFAQAGYRTLMLKELQGDSN